MRSSNRNTSSLSRTDRLVAGVLRSTAWLIAGIVTLIAVFLVLESIPFMREVGFVRLFTDDGWHPTEGSFELTAMAIGSILVTLGAVAIAAPVGVLSAIFSQFYASPAMARIYRSVIALLAGVPSVVYGLWGLAVLVPWIAAFEPPGPSLLAGVIVLAIMIVPTIALFADAAFDSVPSAHWRSAVALGLRRGPTIWRVSLPAARAGVVAGIVLGAVRAIGETMAVLMVCGNVVQIPGTPFEPVRVLTANIALEMGYALGDHRGALFASGMLLLLVVVVGVLVAEIVAKRWGGD